jgi:predicted nucleic acid-binding protein
VSYLLDTNVVSEWMKTRPHPGVVRWLAEVDEDRVFLSVVAFAELRFGIERLPHGARRRRLDAWLAGEMPVRFEGRVLDVDIGVADAWGRIVARAQAAGRPVSAMDALMAATAERHDLVLVTRNISDFERLGVNILNPWTTR